MAKEPGATNGEGETQWKSVALMLMVGNIFLGASSLANARERAASNQTGHLPQESEWKPTHLKDYYNAAAVDYDIEALPACAKENGYCDCAAGSQVAFGAEGQWTMSTNPFPTRTKCSPHAFGGTDPPFHNRTRCVCLPAAADVQQQPTAKFLSETRATKVAICVTGMPGRLHPEALLRSVVAANAPSHTFDVIYALQPPAAELYFSTMITRAGHGQLAKSRFGSVGSEEAVAKIIRDLEAQIRAEVAAKAAGQRQGQPLGRAARIHVLKFIADLSPEEWHSHFGLASHQALDRIEQFKKIQWRVLNMYHHEVKCAEKIRELETSRGVEFDYIIRTREDIWFWNNVDLAALTRGGLVRGFDPTKGAESQTVTPCDIVTKNCLAWEGLNMRFQILRREIGFHFLHNRLQFYKSLYKNSTSPGTTIHNTEKFEMVQAQRMGMTTCPRTVTEVPAAATRRLDINEHCYLLYCNTHGDLKTECCDGSTCTTPEHARACYDQWNRRGKADAREPNPETCAADAAVSKTPGSEFPICFFELEVQGCFPPAQAKHVRAHFCDMLKEKDAKKVLKKQHPYDIWP